MIQFRRGFAGKKRREIGARRHDDAHGKTGKNKIFGK